MTNQKENQQKIKNSIVDPPINMTKEFQLIHQTIQGIEESTKQTSNQLNESFDNLRKSLEGMVDLSQQKMQVFEESSNKMNQTILVSVRSLETLIKKSEKLDVDMKKIVLLAKKVHKIKESVGTLDTSLKKILN
ncbi:hypothetical protein M0813_18786 [Anaeramoeba flamelloides]|uniref:BLOC-1-related complex subunit 6 C-terminal helix domain-containing protein n=1 Tax=Anaeramoeba flamelloides TaxID=1746091 RepID=A0ABQ8YS57_9EUKA|nr:hypothetical protein M0813_18786 [Anaeramoeba flamelloides]